MGGLYTIGALARAAAVPTSTVRYYERAGLLSPEGRSMGNYRSYTTRSLKRLRFIRAAQANGFTLGDIAGLQRFRDGKTTPCKAVQQLIEERLVDIKRRAEELRQVRTVLESSLKVCLDGESAGKCRVMEDLELGSVSSSRKLRPRPRSQKP
jgi:MerR family mercuric resistance operon transcriptional regulator